MKQATRKTEKTALNTRIPLAQQLKGWKDVIEKQETQLDDLQKRIEIYKEGVAKDNKKYYLGLSEGIFR